MVLKLTSSYTHANGDQRVTILTFQFGDRGLESSTAGQLLHLTLLWWHRLPPWKWYTIVVSLVKQVQRCHEVWKKSKQLSANQPTRYQGHWFHMCWGFLTSNSEWYIHRCFSYTSHVLALLSPNSTGNSFIWNVVGTLVQIVVFFVPTIVEVLYRYHSGIS